MYNLIAFLVIVLAIILFAKIIIGSGKAEKINLEETKEYCKENGYEFIRNMRFNELPEILQNFNMFQRHIGYKDFHSIVKGNFEDNDFSLQTFIYPGNNGTYGRLVCIIRKDGANLPKFYLRDTKKIADSVGRLFGKQDINPGDDKDFSDRFLLQGEDENEVLKFFNEKRRRLIKDEHLENYEYEAEGKFFLLSAPFAPSVPVAEYKAMLAKSSAMLKALEV